MPVDLAHHWQTLAVNQSPAAGTDYPFVAPSDDVRYLLGDLWLSFRDDRRQFIPPLRVSRMLNFGSAGEVRRDMVITDSAEIPQVVVDTRDITDYIDTAWGEHLRTLCWIGASAVLRCTMRTSGPPWDQERTWSNDIAVESGELDARTWQRMPLAVKSIKVGSLVLSGDIELVEGYNISLVIEPVAATDGRRRRTRIRMRAVPGNGIGRYPASPENEPAIKRINTVGPTSSGHFTLDADGCLWLQHIGTIVNSPERSLNLGGVVFQNAAVRTLGAVADEHIYGRTIETKATTRYTYTVISSGDLVHAALAINNDCAPCCTCDDFVNTYKGLTRMFNRYFAIGRNAERIRDQLQYAIDRWTSQAECRRYRNINLVVRAEEKGGLFIGGAYCNNTTCCITPLLLRARVHYYRNGVEITPPTASLLCNEAYRSGTDTNNEEVRYIPAGTWPQIDTYFAAADPHAVSRFRLRLRFPPQEDGDVIKVTLTAHFPDIYEPSTGKKCDVPVLEEASPYPVRAEMEKQTAFSPLDGCYGSGRYCEE